MKRRESKEFIEALINRVAEVSVSASALRNQGAGGIIGICRDHFRHLDLLKFSDYLNSSDFKEYLDEETQILLNKFPSKGHSWGAARKALNLFFRDVCYNHYLRAYLSLPSEDNFSVFQNLEIPLDKDVAVGLSSVRIDLPKWNSIKSLSPEQNKVYQDAAVEEAEKQQTLRVHLDMEYWRRNK